MATAAPSRPLIFISASNKDSVWRDRLRATLDVHRLTLWFDTGHTEGSRWTDEIRGVLSRARVALVLLSPVYLESRYARSELAELAALAAAGPLVLFPVVVRDCDWNSVTELRDVQVWAMGRPLDNLVEREQRRELQKIGEEIARLAYRHIGQDPTPDHPPASESAPDLPTDIPLNKSSADLNVSVDEHVSVAQNAPADEDASPDADHAKHPPREGATSTPDDAYVPGPAGYTSEFVGVGGTRPVNDALGVKGMAHRLAELVALRETKMPLAIGLFGDWGSGKSHFMNLIDRRLKDLAQAGGADGPWCGEIVPIYFNAWHYLDANLWASLVTEIFDGLFRHLQPKQDVLEIARAQLREAGGAAALAEEEATRAKAEVTAATTALQDARERSENARQILRGLRDNLSALIVPQLASPQTRARVEAWLGVTAEMATLEQLAEKHRDMATVPGRVRELWRRVAARGRWWRIGWLLGLLVVGPLAVRWIAESIPYVRLLLERVGPSVRIALEWIIGVVTWLLPGFVAVQRHLREMERLQAQAEVAQQRRAADPDVVAAERRVVQTEATARTAETRLADARSREQQLAQTVDDLLPTRRLSRFIEARARSADYRGQLGLVSLARRDFQELSDIFTDRDVLAKKIADAPEKATDLQRLGDSIDRIVLFVDDLDRCQPEKIVDVLQAVHLLLAYPLFGVIVGVDQRCLRQSLRTQFGGLLTGDRPDADGQPRGDNDERPATPLDYLEKIFHVPFHLPPMNKDGFGDLMTALTTPPDPAAAAKATGAVPAPSAGTVAGAAGHAAGQHAEPGTVGANATGGQAHPANVAGLHVDASGSPTPPKTIGSVPLHAWERAALKDYHQLVRTPRGATRFLNTYRLLRAGVPETEWAAFRGDGATRGDFRIAMLLLAAAAGQPAIARHWFGTLRAQAPQEMATLDPDRPAEWQQFTSVYAATVGFAPTRESIGVWIDRVEQFAF